MRTNACVFRAGFSLAEVTIALGIAAFCLITVFGLLSAGLTSNMNSTEQTCAAAIATAISADLRAAPVSSSTTPLFGIALSSGTPTLYQNEDATLQTSAAAAKYKAVVTIGTPASGKLATPVDIKISWPALAPNPAGSLEVCTALNRN